MNAVRRRAIVAIALSLVAGGCGPKPGLEVGLKDYSTDILFGSPVEAEPIPVPLPTQSLDAGVPSLIVSPPPLIAGPGTPPPRPPRVVACPDPPVDAVAKPAAARISAAPATGTYQYRQSGTFVAESRQVPYPPQSDRVVTNVTSNQDGTLDTFDVVIKDQMTQTTTYKLRGGVTDLFNGLYITKIVTDVGDGSPRVFAPVDLGLRIIALPAAKNVAWQSSATDPQGRTNFNVNGTIKGTQQVNACGTLLQGWEVSLTGTITGPNKNVTLTATYVVAPQMGGVIIADSVTQQGTDEGKPVFTQVSSVLNSPTPKPLPG